MTVNLSINDLINKNYDISQYREILDNGILSQEQVKILMIIKNIQENKILLSIKERKELENYFDKFSFNFEIEKKQDLPDVNQIDATKTKEPPKGENKSIIKIEEDPDLMTCPAISKNGKIYRIKYISQQNKIKMLALL